VRGRGEWGIRFNLLPLNALCAVDPSGYLGPRQLNDHGWINDRQSFILDAWVGNEGLANRAVAKCCHRINDWVSKNHRLARREGDPNGNFGLS
jgi:hypothetical protein